MHDFLRRHAGDFRPSASGHELTAIAARRVAKVVRCEPNAALRNVDIDGINGWDHFHWLTPGECAHLNVGPGRWLLALRPFTPGVSLAEQAPPDGFDVALKLAYRVRDLHELGIAHGDLQPGNVVVSGLDVWLIDLSPARTRAGDAGHVAGSAPLMAPELWAGSSPSPASDVYALGCMTCWLGTGRFPHTGGDLGAWARAHRDGQFDVTGLPATIAGVVGRALSLEPGERPPIQSFIDALRGEGASADVPPMVAGGLSPLDVDGLVANLNGSGHVHIIGAPRTGRTHAARAIATGLATSGRSVVCMRGQDALAIEPGDDDDPWRAVSAMLHALAWESGEPVGFPALGRGDRLWAFEQFTETALGLIGDRAVSIVWDDFGTVRPDTRAWWAHFVDAISRRGVDVSTVVVSAADVDVPAVRVEIAEISATQWNRWRATTLRTEVRDANQAWWEQLVAEHAPRVAVMLRKLDQEVGARQVAAIKARRDVDTGMLQSMQANWRARVDTLTARCAFDEVIETVSTLFETLEARRSADPATTHDLLDAWTTAVVSGGGAGTTEALRAALARHSPASARIAIHRARLANALGTHLDGLAALEGVTSAEPALRAEIAGWRAQLALSCGQMDDVGRYAAEGLAELGDAPPSVAAHLRVLSLAPDALAGDTDALDQLAALAPSLERDSPPILRARLHAYRALGLTRIGALDDATDAHLRALEQIESGGLSAELSTYLLNAGTAYHRQGRLGLAREYYARGLRVSQPTTRASTRALLHANQANVDLALGRFEEARNLVRRGLDVARSHDLSNVEVMCRSVDADIELASGDPAKARELYLTILSDAPRLGARQHQVAEVELALAEAALLVADPAEAALRLDNARRMIEEAKFADLEHHHGILRARLQWLDGGSVGTMAGIELFRRNLLGAEGSGNHRLVLRQTPTLMAQLQREGLDELIEEVTRIVQRSRNAIAMGLGRELRRDFFANLPPMDVVREADRPAAEREVPRRHHEPDSGADVEPFYRMLSLNEVILRSESIEAMLPTALEIAMSLSHAERGFILLRDDRAGRVGDFRIAASRDVGGDPIPSPHLAVSLTIAEEAARTGRTVVTLNAREDGRFSDALSVVDLDLTSVLCVPVRDGTGLLGALYVDHRFRPGVFEGRVPRMMEAFGHQLALAITNVQRLEELERTRAELAELLDEREAMMVGLERQVVELTEAVERGGESTLRASFPEIAFGSRAMERVLSQVERVARGDIPVVVTGESGVGKELIARAVHFGSPRRSGPFIAFNCGAISETLFESEMFGHVKGAFTGADIDRKGLFQAAGGGTIFLDEVGEMPSAMQVKLLRVLQERQVRRVGESTSTPVDVRVVAATNRDLLQMVREGQFREDLYYRLAAFVIEIPPLRDRREDIPLIAPKLVAAVAEELGRDLRLTASGARLLAQCEWYGNVRELENTLRTAAVMADGDELGEAELAPLVRLRSDAPARQSTTRALETRGRRRKADRLDVVEAMRRAGDDRTRAAEILEVSERTLYRYLKRWDLY